MARERQDQAASQRVEYQSVCYGVHDTSRDRTHARKRLETVSCNCKSQRQCFADTTLTQIEKILDIQGYGPLRLHRCGAELRVRSDSAELRRLQVWIPVKYENRR